MYSMYAMYASLRKQKQPDSSMAKDPAAFLLFSLYLCF